MDIAVRPAHEGDAAALTTLDSVVLHDPERAVAIRGWIEAGECLVAAAPDGRLLGYAVVTRHFFGQPMAEMLMVDPNSRRQGAGRALLRHVIAQCDGAKLWSSTNLSNQPMQALLAAEGFRLSGFIENLDEGDPELVFVKVF